MKNSHTSEPGPAPKTELIRGIGLSSATALSMIDMIGVGPFITIPLMVSAVGGPQAMLGWIVGAVFAMCDGLVWAELGAAMPGSGGSYRYLSEIYGPKRLGRLISFLFIWQISFSAPLSIASGCLGFAQYAGYVWPLLATPYFSRELRLPLPVLGSLQARTVVTPGTFVAIAVCLLAMLLLYRRITSIGRLSKFLWAGVDHLRWAYPLQCRPSVQFSPRRVSPFTWFLSGFRVRHVDCYLRLLGLLQRVLLRWGSKGSGQDHSARSVAIYLAGSLSIYRHEHQYFGCRSLAGT